MSIDIAAAADGTDAVGGSTSAEPAVVKLCLLDGFRLTQGDTPIDVSLSAQRLLAFLAFHDRPVLRTYVAANLWIDKTEDRANANLRSALWRLRQPRLSLVEATASHLCLAPNIEVDVRVAVERARRLIAGEADNADVCAPVLDGDLLPDWYDDEWVAIERERLRQLRLYAMEALCRHLTGVGRTAQAVEAGLAAVAAEPLRESSHRALILAHLAEGNRAEALRQYASYRSVLWEALEVSPSPQMEALIVDVRSPSAGMAVTATRHDRDEVVTAAEDDGYVRSRAVAVVKQPQEIHGLPALAGPAASTSRRVAP